MADTSRSLSIVIADRGWVWVGETSETDGWLHVKGARCIRRWGTSEGLGELAAKGPRPNTKMDAASDLRVPLRAVIGLIPCEVAAWSA